LAQNLSSEAKREGRLLIPDGKFILTKAQDADVVEQALLDYLGENNKLIINSGLFLLFP
jgi:hypothetical protein